MVDSENPINIKNMNSEKRQRLDEEFNFLYDDTAQDLGGYESEEQADFDSFSCYE